MHVTRGQEVLQVYHLGDPGERSLGGETVSEPANGGALRSRLGLASPG